MSVMDSLFKAKRYARAQKLHREFAANAERLARKNWQDADLMNNLAWQFSQNALGLDAGFCRRYLSNIIRFDLGPREQAGLLHFYMLASELGLARHVLSSERL